MKRKSISKETRWKVYEKYNGHCAYCGCELDYKDMQVDHVIPVYWTDEVLKNRYEGDIDTIDNYMPSCKMCNFYKSTFGIEDFRKRIEAIPDRLEKVFIYRLAIKYGFIKVQKPNIKFYFEERLNTDYKQFLNRPVSVYKEPILTDKEKEYLSTVIKPFRDKIVSIGRYYFGSEEELIIYFDEEGNDTMKFPPYEAGTMYKGMQINKEYTLEELGL